MKQLFYCGKGGLCRVLALLLCLTMLSGIAPVFPQASAAESAVFIYNQHKLQYGQWGANGYAPDTVYNYYKTMSGNSQELSTYSGAKTGPFANTATTPFYYYEKSAGAAYSWGDQAYGWVLVGVGSWASTAILVPNSGTYTLSYNAGVSSASGKLNIYFAPIDAESPRAEEYFVGTIDPTGTASDWNKLFDVGTVTAEAGEYLVTAEITSTGNLYGGSFQLSSTAAKKTMTLSVGNGSALTTNRRATSSYPISATIDGKTVSAADATYVVAEPVDSSVVSVSVENGNLKLFGLAEGTTTVNLRMAVNGVMGWVELPVSVTNNVVVSAYDVDLGFSRNEIGVGGTHYTEVKLFYYDEQISLLNATNFSATSNAPSVAAASIEQVDDKLMLSVTGCSEGYAKLTVKFDADGYTHTETLSVKVAEQSYSYNLERLHWGELSTDGTSPSYLSDWDKIKYLSNVNGHTTDLYRFHAQSVGSTWIWSALSVDRGPIFTGKNGDFAAIRVRLDEIGVYRPSVSYFAHPDGETFNVYFAPASAENWLSDEYLLGEIDTYAEEELTGQVKEFSYQQLQAGEYIVGFEATGSSAYQIGYFGGITFDMVGIPWITSYAEIPSVLSVGGDATVNLRAVFGGKGIPFKNATLSVEDETVVAAELTADGVSENAILELDGRKVGDTEITVTMQYGNLTGKLVIPISVQEFSLVRRNYRYDWKKVYYGPWSTSAYNPCEIDDYGYTTRGDPNEMCPDITTDPWMYGGDGGNITEVGWNSSSRDYGIYLNGQIDSYTSYKIRVDQTGVYTPSVSYTSWKYGGMTDVYLAPADAENPRESKYLLGTYSGYSADLVKGLSLTGDQRLMRAGEYLISYVIAGTSAHAMFSDSFSLKAPQGNYIHLYTDEYDYVLQGQEISIPLNVIRNDAPIDFRQIDSYDVSINDTSIADVELKVENNKGYIIVKGKNVGVANVTVTAKRYSNTCEITIPVDVVGIGERKLSLDKTYLIPGETTKLHASVALTNGIELTPDDLNRMGVTTSVATLKGGIVSLSDDGVVTGVAAGSTAIRMTMVFNGKTIYSGVSVRVYDNQFSSLSVSVDDATMYPDHTQQLQVSALTNSTSASSNVIGAENVQYTYKSSGAGLTVSNTGLLTAKEVGTYWVDVSGTFNGTTHTTGIQIIVSKNGYKSLTLDVPITRLKVNGDTMQATAKLTTLSGEVLGNESVTFKLSNNCASITADGVLTGLAAGDTVLTATAGGLSASVNINVTTGKAYSSYYTKEKMKNMRYNVENFLWASNLPNAYGAAADQYLDKLEMLYDNITTQELPRAAAVGVRWDPNMYRCRYCNVDLREAYSNYPWIVDPINMPWKIQCPACSRYFPSNDFENFYKSGIDANGNWSYELSKKNGQAYLVNTLHPEKGTGWGVDDGYGYRTGKTITLENVGSNASNYGKTHEEVHTYMAYYNHWGSWYGSGNTSMYGLTSIAIDRLANAYIYTGDPKYGRIGAILISRVADVYPDMEIAPYFPWHFNSDSTSPYGKIVGCIWESGIVNGFIKAYDAFYDLYDDPEVISYLSAKATKYNQTNKKTTGNLIRDHIEENLIREAYRSVLNGNIHGNFGMHQSVATNCAVVLDSPTESKAMIDWLFKSESGSTKGDWKGGNFTAQIFENVSRDGTGMEAAPNYNGLWINSVNTIIDTLGGYQGYTGSDLYQNPKIIKMYKMHFPLTQTRKGTYPIGDSGATAKPTFHLPGISGLSKAFLATGDVELAQMIYFRNGNSTKNLNGDIFSNATELRTKIEAVIAEHGEYPFDSSMQMSGFGIDILRSGTLTESADTQQDFWIYYGKTGGHGHPAALNLGMDAYGLDIAPDLGYPEAADGAYKNIYWGQASVNHNLVMVNDERQTAISPNGTPLHFDDVGRVKLSDVCAKAAYPTISDYRRALVSVQVDDEISYGVDFFLVNGGNEHVYSFHALSNEITEASSNLSLVPQSGGTYAGSGVAFGSGTTTNGYNFLYNVRRASNPGKEFTVNFKIDDFRNTISADRQLYLKMTMLNDFDLKEVAFAKGQPPQRDGNPTELEFVLARRSGSNLLSLFTTVFEPYDKTSYITSREQVAMTRTGGATPGTSDCAKAVKITLKNGRVDYVVFATNKEVQYRIDNLFEFKGSFGVYTLENGIPTYAYINDGTMIGQTKTIDAYTGTILDFTKTLSFENSLTVSLGQSLADVTDLVGRSIYVANQGGGNATYVIKGAKRLANGNVVLDLGDVTLIRSLSSTTATNSYTYDVAAGQTFRIPLSVSSNNTPVFDVIPKQSIPINQKNTFVVSATDPNGQTMLSYRALSLPSGATFDASTRTFTWTPRENQVGTHTAVFSVTNGTRTAEMTVEFDVFYNTNVSAVNIVNGAQIRLVGKTGLRFISRVSPHFLAEIEAKGATDIEYGTLLVPSDGTVDLDSFVIGGKVGPYSAIKVPAVYNYSITDEWIQYTAVLVDIAPKNFRRVYAARAYVKYRDSSGEHVIYGDTRVERSIYQIAEAALNDSGRYSDDEIAVLKSIINNRNLVFTVTEPAEGAATSDVVCKETNPPFTVQTSWTRTGGYAFTGEFVESTDYTVRVVLTMTDGSVFDDGFSIELNGKTPDSCTISEDGSTLTFTKTFIYRDNGFTGIY